MVEFEDAFLEFVKSHCEQRRGERLRRLQEGLGHAEKLFLQEVWWPAFAQFHQLHPEFEVYDFKDGTRYIDFAYIRPHLRMAIELDGFGPHHKNITRWQFSDQLTRQNHLIIDGWKVIRFSVDDIKEKPRFCQQTLQQLMGRWLGEEGLDETSIMEKEVVKLAGRLCRPITPKDVCESLRIEAKYARKLLQSLVEKLWMQADSGESRVRSYRLTVEGRNYFL